MYRIESSWKDCLQDDCRLHLPSNINTCISTVSSKEHPLHSSFLHLSLALYMLTLWMPNTALDAFFLDVHKAFVSVGHMVLLSKHQSIGFVGEALSWFKGHLDNRQHCVRLEGDISTAVVDLKRSLYHSLVKCHLSYCSPVWRPYLLQDIRKIESLQRRATKYITSYQLDYISRD